MKPLFKKSLILIMSLSLIGFFGCAEKKYTKSTEISESSAITSSSLASESSTTENTSSLEETSAESSFAVHFIDVGQGDAALILCDGESMLIDGGSSDQSELMYSYLQKQNVQSLKYVVATHPDDDHIGGLSGALSYARTERAFCSVDAYESRPFTSFQKLLNEQNVSIEIPTPDESLLLGCARVSFIAPLEAFEGTNNNSIVIKISYGQTSFLFTGDAEFSEEDSLIASGTDISADVLKVAHHGSYYSTSRTFLNTVSPQYAIISCGKENEFGFPKQSVLDRLKERNIELYRTDLCGDILVVSDGKDITITTEKAGENPFTAPVIPEYTEPSLPFECDYVANKSSKKFHRPSCEAVGKMAEENRWYYSGDRQALIDEGYEPCQICNP